MDYGLLRLEMAFAAAVRTMCLAHGHMDLASRWRQQMDETDRATLGPNDEERVRVDFTLAMDTHRTITATEPPGSLVTMMASMMDGQAEAALEAISPCRAGGDCLPIPARHGGGDRRRGALAAGGAGHGL